jgi:methyl-accepting chemotaxis protein
MSGIASQTSQRIGAVVAVAEYLSARVHAATSASEELSSSIAEISRQVHKSAAVAQHAVDEAMCTDTVVQALASGAQKIGEIVGLNRSIAGQTNLLPFLPEILLYISGLEWNRHHATHAIPMILQT